MRRSLVDVLAPAAFVAGLAALAYGWGFVTAEQRLPPRDTLAAMGEAAKGVWSAYLKPEARAAGDYVQTVPAPPAGPIAAGDRARAAEGLTLVVGYRPEDGFGARLVDLDGRVRHAWRARFSEVFPEPRHLLWKAPDAAVAWHGVRLFPNGDLVFNFHGNSFPYGGGLVRLDKDSRVVWALPRNTHHDVVADPDDGGATLWVPDMRYRPEAMPEVPGLKPWFYEDTLLRVAAADGKVLGEVSALKGIAAGLPGLLSTNYDDHLRVESSDPLHLNAAEPLPAALASGFPGLAAGDLLVSLRNVNALAVLDPRTGRAKRAIMGPFAKQHDADWLPGGRIMLFDNRGGEAACGGSRILELDYVTQAVTWSYDGCGTPEGFLSELRGMQQVLPNGNVLVAEAMRGRVFEVAREDRRIVWEYRNILEGAAEGGRVRVGIVTHAERVPPEALGFLDPARPSS